MVCADNVEKIVRQLQSFTSQDPMAQWSTSNRWRSAASTSTDGPFEGCPGR
jgi:hypothetical protein